jgi:hypothetical protein
VTRCDTSAWPYPIIRFLRGEVSADALLAMADSTDKMTEARCYVGMDLSQSGRREEALPHFRWVQENGTQDSLEYFLVLSELRRIEGK